MLSVKERNESSIRRNARRANWKLVGGELHWKSYIIRPVGTNYGPWLLASGDKTFEIDELTATKVRAFKIENGLR